MASALRLSLLLALAVGCGRAEPPAQGPDSGVAVDLVSTRIEGGSALFAGPPGGRATLRVTNGGRDRLAFRGTNGAEPVVRLAVRGPRGEWVEREPAWVECGTGLGDGVLEPSAAVLVDVAIPSVETEFRVGVGTWPASVGERPRWERWRWTWSRPFAVAAPGEERE